MLLAMQADPMPVADRKMNERLICAGKRVAPAFCCDFAGDMIRGRRNLIGFVPAKNRVSLSKQGSCDEPVPGKNFICSGTAH